MRSLKISLACCFGAFIGTLVALNIQHSFWWVGLPIGGLTGYLFVEPIMVLKAIPAWHQCINWRPQKIQLKIIFIAPILALSIFSNCSILASIFAPMPGLQGVLISIGCILLFGLVAGILVWESARHTSRSAQQAKYLEIRKWAWQWSPIMICGYWIPKIIWEILKAGVPALARFIKQIFILIHSDIRLLCGIDTTIGTAIGFLFGAVIVGAIAGGVIGIVNYKLISQRVLRLHIQPQHS